MNSLFVSFVKKDLENLANNPNLYGMIISTDKLIEIRDRIISIANSCATEEPLISQQLLHAKSFLFPCNQFGQARVNPIALGEIIFGLNYLINKKPAQNSVTIKSDDMWSYIHPLIQKSSKSLYLTGHYANAAEDAFIEINDRVKHLFEIIKPGEKIPDGDTAMNTVFSAQSPLVEFCDRNTLSGQNKQKGYMQMLAGAISALRNPKAHSNTEVLSAKESYRRLATASMLMYAIDDAVKYSMIKE